MLYMTQSINVLLTMIITPDNFDQKISNQ